MADDRDSLLREVDEELRREQMQKIWERYNGLILGVAALIVVGVGGLKYWEGRNLSAAEANGAAFEAALRLSDEKKTDDALKAFEAIAVGGSGGYAGLAQLHVAGEQAKAGKSAEALAAYEALAKGSSGDRLLRDFAALQAASLRLGEADFTEMQNRLTALTAAGQPFRTSASELLGLAAFKAGKLEEARNLLEPLLIDPTAARAIQDRIKIVLAEIASTELANAQPSAAPAPPDAAKPGASPPEQK
ncbi:MAG: tetratricopeptide repeat protein [Hyphomicrobium sp.]